MRLISISILLLIQFIAIGQNRLEVGLKSGEVIYPNSLVKKNRLLRSFLLVDDYREIELSAVDYYQTTADYFIVRDLNFYSNQVMERIEHGKIDLYTFSKVVNAPMTMGANGVMMGGGMQTKNYYYYEKDGNLQLMSFTNLERDLADNAAALKHVLSAKSKKGKRILIWGAGIAMTLAGLNQMVDEANAKGPPYEDPLEPNGLFVVGLVTLVVPLFMSPNSERSMKDAIRVYNL